MKSGRVTNNTDKRNGGIGTTGLAMSAGEVSRNKAEFGGDVYLESSATFSQSKGVISGSSTREGEGEELFKQQ
jgi:hypothetical protein